MEWRESEGVRWLEADLGGARAAFSTRVGGVSEPPFDSLNLGLLTDDADDAVVENRRRLAAALGFRPSGSRSHARFTGPTSSPILIPCPQLRPAVPYPPMARKRNSGGSGCRRRTGRSFLRPGLAPLVFTADCLPVALSGPGGAAMLHCGWRGLAAGILAKGAEAVGATDAAIGPGIAPCCYEVGPEVLNAFSSLGPGITLPADGPEIRAEDDISAHRQLDLVEVARRLLAAVGVERVEVAGLCTSCETELFFSHRRDAGRTGRQGGLVWIES